MSLIICVTGGREHPPFRAEFEIAWLNELKYTFDIRAAASGGARGADTEFEYWCVLAQIPWRRFPADWEKYGKRAGFVRNKQMLQWLLAYQKQGYDIAVIAFKGNRGTGMMKSIANKAGVPVIEYTY